MNYPFKRLDNLCIFYDVQKCVVVDVYVFMCSVVSNDGCWIQSKLKSTEIPEIRGGVDIGIGTVDYVLSKSVHSTLKNK